jgi:hypothetical protein
MRIRKLDTANKRDVHRFINCPFPIYQGNRQWVPTVEPEIRLVLNRSKHPFYRHSTADFFIAEENGDTLGRICVLDNQAYNHHHGTRVAFFYYFDVVNQPRTAHALLSAAADWARDRKLATMIGPKGFLQGDGMGMLYEGYEHRTALGIPYNHPYYNDFALDFGLRKETDFVSGYLPGDHQLPQRMYDIAEKVRQRRGYWIKSFTSEKELRSWILRIGRLYNKTFVDNWEFCPTTDAEFEVIGERMISIAHPRLIKLVMKGEEIIGFVFGFMDISAAIQRTRGRIWPLGWFHLLREFRRTDWVNFNGTGLLPEYQGLGGNAILYTELAKTVRDFNFAHAEIVQIEEQNAKSLGDMAALGVRWHKRHRIYRLDL